MKLFPLLQRLLAGLAVVAALGAASTAQAVVVTKDIGGVASVDELDDPDNIVDTMQVGALTRVVGISWDVDLFADAPSYLSEISLRISNGLGAFLDLAPGFIDTSSGSGSYTSGGMVDLVALGLDFFSDGNGTLTLQFYDAFDDFSGQADGRWERGSVLRVDVIPEPGSMALILAGLLACGAARRRAS